jgi:tripartite-type tricarboxylate transporter receptor subunit TctC
MPGFDLIAWLGMFAPAGTPPDVIEKLSQAMKDVLAKPSVRKQFHKAGIEAFWTDQKDFGAFVKSELVKWTRLIKAAGIEAQ